MIARTIYPKIQKSIKNRPVTLITGARQVGKSTLCGRLIKDYHYNYVTLDNLRERQTALEDPEMFLQLHEAPLIIDEVQYAPTLFPVIEELVNKQKFDTGKNYGMYVLTGSQMFRLMENVSESLAGRVSIIHMPPLSLSEINNVSETPFEINIKENKLRTDAYTIPVNELYSHIVRGFYPELYDNTELETEQFYSDYMETYLSRDINKLINLDNLMKFRNFMELLASFTGEELVYDTLAKAIGVKIDTIKKWISILVAGDIIYLLQPYNDTSIVKRIVKRPKIYFNDTGLACYLARLSNPEVLMNSRFNGRFMETYIINEIRKSYLNNSTHCQFYYYRDSNQNEIDFIILKDGELHLVECKNGVSFNAKDVSGFKQLEGASYPIGTSCIICNTQTIYPIKENVIALPVSAI